MVAYTPATGLMYYNGTAWTAVSGSASPLTTKGDLYTYSTTNARLAIGTNGQTLVANSGGTTGNAWQDPIQQNPVLNSAMQVWQRGTSIGSITTTATYTADRWAALGGATTTLTVSRQATGDTTNLPNIQYCSRVQRNSGQTGTTGIVFANSFETINSIPFAGKTVTMSFYARAGANYSSASSALTGYVVTGTGTDQNRATGAYTGDNTSITSTVTLTTTWQRFTITGTIPTSATELSTYFFYTPVGTAGTNDYYEITGVQLEVGSVATPFHTFSTTIEAELAACQRYYYRTTAPTSGNNSISFGTAYSTSAIFVSFSYPATMRIAPSALEYSNTQVNDGVTAINANTMNLTNTTASGTLLQITSLSAAVTQFRPYLFLATTNGYIGFTAEL
jgi:hypothetical protein